ncbi:MAG TPA: hypothetical protein VF433_05990 [Cellvibrio sp.]
MYRKFLFGLISLSFASATLLSNAAQTDRYLVTTTISSNGAVLGKPALLVEPGTDSSAIVSGANGYELSLNISPEEKNAVLAKSSVKTSTGEAHPSLLLEIGKESTVKIGEIELRLLVTKAEN